MDTSNNAPPSPSAAQTSGSLAWLQFLEDVRLAVESLCLPPGQECLYRGHAKLEWELQPTLLRHALVTPTLNDVEADLFFEFRAHARELHGLNLSDWDMLFYMRHYGVPTRLLDWTDSLGVAMYFALEGEPTSPCIWMLNPFVLNDDDFFAPKNLGWDEDEEEYYDYGELLVEEEPIDWEAPLAIYPDKNNPRLFAQRGYFTIHGTDLRPLEKIPGNERYLKRVELPLEAIPHARHFLQMAGMDRYRIYGDLESLAHVLRDKHLPSPGHAPRVPSGGRERKRERQNKNKRNT